VEPFAGNDDEDGRKIQAVEIFASIALKQHEHQGSVVAVRVKHKYLRNHCD
jgi:hypothetical protein